MLVAALTAALHYLALALGLGAVHLRGRALRDLAQAPTSASRLDALFGADNAWGLAALLWIATGLARAFGGLEKGTDFYLHAPLFWVKMALFGAVFALELLPMATFIRWRVARGRGRPLLRLHDGAFLGRLARLNSAQLVLVLLIPFVASLMARGFLL